MVKGYVLKCSQCGVEKKTNYKQYQKIKLANMVDTYICRKCKKK